MPKAIFNSTGVMPSLRGGKDGLGKEAALKPSGAADHDQYRCANRSAKGNI
jgi:hypothetical protein